MGLLRAIAVVGANVLAFAAAGLRAEVAVWELPSASEPAGFQKRDGWKPAARTSRFEHGIAIENERLAVLVAPGAGGPVVASRDGGIRAELRVLGAGEVTRVWRKDADPTEATIGFAAGTVEAELTLAAGAPYLAVRPGKGATRLQAQAAARYALAPSFTTEATVYDATQHKADSEKGTLNFSQRKVECPLFRMALLMLLDGGNGILALMWKDTAGAGMEAARKADDKSGVRNVELAAAGRGPERRFVSATVEFLGKPVYVGLLQGSGVWHSLDVRKLPGGKTMPVAWQRPFDAAWKVDMHVTGYDKREVAALLAQAADLGLSSGCERDWRSFYLTLDEKRQDADPLRVEASYFRPAGKDGRLPPATANPREGDDRVWPFVFRGRETLVTVPAEWPCYPDPTKDRLGAAEKQRAAAGKEPLYPIHVYGGFIMYPLDRTTKTPIDRLTVVDLMRQALGIGPCKLDWLEDCTGQGAKEP